MAMRMSEFWALVEQEFGGPTGRSRVSDHVLVRLGNRTAAELLERGVPPRDVWEGLCDDFDVPPQRRFLRDTRRPQR